tara:strand:+ start:31437 stop:31577 length:141 start_codon:yes stop_codon:yes gene_type:complete
MQIYFGGVLTKMYNGISAAFVGYFESRIGDILFASPIAIVSLEIEK